jgi:uncharacterized membrane protein YhaH (DUF805 family)
MTRRTGNRNSFLTAQHRRNRDAFWAWFMFCAIVGVLMLGLMAWALIELVSWITTK